LIADRAGPHFAIAQFYFKNSEFEKSLASFERYQQGHKVWQDPSDAIAFYFLGNIHANLGNIDLAKKNFTSALSAYPNKQIQGLVKDALNDL
jgi:tetratricopeptide (TPR) repeat protein